MILVVDNYDSFTYNLVQLLRVQGGDRWNVEVVRNDAESAAAMLERRPAAIVLSPGPGRPEDAGECCALVRAEPRIPILGVCLGHQVIGQVFGARVGKAPRLMHGKVSAVSHNGIGIFAGLPVPFDATRYHSLAVEAEGLPAELEPVAWSEGGTLQAMRHRRLPYWGVQFHPESILTAAGPALVKNFLALQAGAESLRLGRTDV